MSTGALPVVSPVESVLEWIDEGVNGLVVSATDVPGIVRTILRAIDSPDLRASAAAVNRGLIRERADRDACQARILEFYDQVPKFPGQ
jgi:glycosyltransferase involved in cell wall biosynthesis